ncbi:hypothetical protein [Frankia sp. Cr1]|nr:hypothetical protein [Frankia sp. Cr1]
MAGFPGFCGQLLRELEVQAPKIWADSNEIMKQLIGRDFGI